MNNVETIEECTKIDKILEYIIQTFHRYIETQETNAVSFPNFIKLILNASETMFIDKFDVLNEKYKQIHDYIYDICKSYNLHTHVQAHAKETLKDLLGKQNDLLEKIYIYEVILADHRNKPDMLPKND